VQATLCRDEEPELRTLFTGHEVACHWAEQIQAGEIKPHEREPVLVAPLVRSVAEPPPT
jgi:peptide/nickel transport system ATP-binding protein